MNKKILLIFFSVILYACSKDSAIIKESIETFVTYPFSDPDPIPRPDRDYYPYFRFDGYSYKSDSVEWKVVIMENKYIEVHIFPEICGKIWGAIEKSTGNEFIYYNSVVKFRDIGVRGAWTSGGIEMNFRGHTPAVPVDYMIRSNDDGSVSCFIGIMNLRTRTRWETEINLPKDKAYFTTKTSYYNPTVNMQSYYQWSNAAYQTKGNLELIFPGSHYAGHGGDVHTWPVDNSGRDLSMYQNNDFGGSKSYHVVGSVGDFYAAYWHDLNFGAGHHSVYGDKLGKKIWIWSLSRSGGIWEDLLTDNDGQYVELQSGRLFNQASTSSTKTPYKHFGFMPYSYDTFKEYWYPILGIGGVVKANSLGALNVIKEGKEQKIYLSPLQSIKDDVTIYFGEDLKYRYKIDVNTLEKWEKSIANNPEDKPLKVVIGDNKFVYSEERNSNLSNRPLESPADFDWSSVYGLYVDGLNWIYQNKFDIAFERFKACLVKDPLYAPALNQMAELYYRKADFENALKHVTKSLSLNTYDPEANFLFGLISKQLNNLIDSQDGFSVASLTPAYRTAAYIELAKLFILKNELYSAEQFTQRVLDQDCYNQDAILLMALIRRKNGDAKEAGKYIDHLETLSPLNHFSRFERMLLNDDKRSKDSFISLIRNEIPYETFMEMALWYEYIGYTDEARKLLEMSPGNSLVYLKLAQLNHQKNVLESEKYLNNALEQSADFIFPFRMETVPLLEWAISKTDDWKPKYYLGLLQWRLGNKQLAIDLFSKCGQVPESPYFFLAKTNLFSGEPNYNPERDLLKAKELGKDEWRSCLALIDHYLGMNKTKEALTIAKESLEMFPSNDKIHYNYAKCLLANGFYSASLSELENTLISPYEGARFGRITYRQAAVMEGLQLYNENKYDLAIESFNKARLWPENLGVGRPYDVDERIENFLEAESLFHLNQKEKAHALYQEIINYSRNRTGRNNSTDFLYLVVLKRLGMNQQADNFLVQWQRNSPNDLMLKWTRAMINNNRSAAQLIVQEIDTELVGTAWDPRNADTEFELVKAISQIVNLDLSFNN